GDTPVNGNERNGPQPIARDASTTAAPGTRPEEVGGCPPAATRRARPADRSRRPSPSSPAPPVPPLLRDLTHSVRCPPPHTLILLTGIVLLSKPAISAANDLPEDGARPRPLESRFADDRRLD